MVGDTYNDVLEMDRPLTVEKLSDYVRQWLDKQREKKLYTTRASYNNILKRKTAAVVRVLKTLSPTSDIQMEIALRREIGNKCVLN